MNQDQDLSLLEESSFKNKKNNNQLWKKVVLGATATLALSLAITFSLNVKNEDSSTSASVLNSRQDQKIEVNSADKNDAILLKLTESYIEITNLKNKIDQIEKRLDKVESKMDKMGDGIMIEMGDMKKEDQEIKDLLRQLLDSKTEEIN